jgi:hypothetical protein
MERCKYELLVEEYFGIKADGSNINENTVITTDYGQLVNLLAMFEQRVLANADFETLNYQITQNHEQRRELE